MKDYGNDATRVEGPKSDAPRPEMSRPLNTAHFVAQALDALNFMESSVHGGPDDPEVYAEVMIEVSMHCARAAQVALERKIQELREEVTKASDQGFNAGLERARQIIKETKL